MENRDIRKRKEEFKNISFRNPNMVPVILKFNNAGDETELKLLVPKAFTFQDFLFSIRRKLKVGEKNALFLQVGEKVSPALDKSFLTVYKEHKDVDGFLYVRATIENHFGSA